MNKHIVKYNIFINDCTPDNSIDILNIIIKESNIHNTNLRYIDWHFRNVSCPAIIDETGMSEIKKRMHNLEGSMILLNQNL